MLQYPMILLPPEAYDFPFPGPSVEWVLPSEAVDRRCRESGTKAPIGSLIYACSFRIGDSCFLFLPQVGPGGVSKRTQDLLRRHEHGHCNGWDRNHSEFR